MEDFIKWLNGFGINGGAVLTSLGILIALFVATTLGLTAPSVFGFLVLITPIFLPYVLFHIFFESWLDFVRLDFKLKQGMTTLEIQFPQDVFKSPLAMELMLGQMYQTAGVDNHVQTYWDGKHHPTYGLEIVSDGGRIHFYINTPSKKFKNLVEAQLYAQYPGIIVTELPIDYTAAVPWDTSRFEYFSLHFGLKKADAYPIKTYIDFGLDKDPKEEFKIDPMAPMLELLGSIRQGEKIWVQILIRANREENFKTGSLHASGDWKADVVAEINKVAQRDEKKKGAFDTESAPRITPGERDTIAAMERTLSKPAFDTKIRVMYIGEKQAYLPGERIGAIISMWRAFEDATRNGIGLKWRTDVDWPWWEDPKGKKRLEWKQVELGHYKRRKYRKRNQGDGWSVLTTEELATLFHPAGKVILTPTLERIPSARAEAPANLPIGPQT